jgi:hypothetical protein
MSIDNNKLTVFNDTNWMVEEYRLIHPLSPSSVICKQCHRNIIYDMRKIEFTHEYHDCKEYTTPCCNYPHADTRGFNSMFAKTGNHDFDNIGNIISLSNLCTLIDNNFVKIQ